MFGTPLKLLFLLIVSTSCAEKHHNFVCNDECKNEYSECIETAKKDLEKCIEITTQMKNFGVKGEASSYEPCKRTYNIDIKDPKLGCPVIIKGGLILCKIEETC